MRVGGSSSRDRRSALAPAAAAEVVRSVRGRVRRRREIPVTRLREPAVERYLIARWEEGVEAMDARHRVPPVLCNTDGDELLFTTDHFGVDRAARAAVEGARRSVAGLEGPDDAAGGEIYTFVRAEGPTAMMPGNTLLDTPFGAATLQFAQRGRQLVIRTSVQFRQVRIPVAQYGAFREFCNELARAFRGQVKVELAKK